MKSIGVLSIIFLLAVSCSAVSRDLRQAAEPEVSFRQLAENPSGYAGRIVVLGGYIIDTRNSDDQTELTVLQSPLRYTDQPQDSRYSEGRFIVTHNGKLNPSVFSRNRSITVAGVVMADETRPLPIIESREIHLWRRYDYPYYYQPEWYYHHPLRHIPPYQW